MTGLLAPLLMLGSVLALAAGYADTLATFHDRWGSTTQGYSHGYLLAAISAWLVWRRRDTFLSTDNRPQPIWLLPIAAASLLWLAADTMQVRIVQQLVLPALLWLWIAAVFGWRCARRQMFALVVLYLAIPVWDVLVLPLRELTVWVTRHVLGIGGIPAYIDGFRIFVPAGAFVVAGGCSGLNYLLVSLTLGLLYAHLYVRGWARRGTVVALAIAVALISNWIRVIALVLIGYYTEMRSELVEDHETFGWLVFGALLLPYMLLLRRFDHPDAAPAHATEAAESGGVGSALVGAGAGGTAGAVAGLSTMDTPINGEAPDVTAAAMATAGTATAAFAVPASGTAASTAPGTASSHGGASSNRIWRILWPMAWLAALVALSGPLLQLARDVLPEAEPAPLATPQGARISAAPTWQPDYRGYDRAQHFRVHARGNAMELSVYTWLEQAQGREMIYYRNQIVGEDQRLSAQSTRQLDGLEVNELMVHDGRQRRLVWWYYRTAGQTTTSETVSKLLQLLGLVNGRASAELVVLSSRCETGDCERARARLYGQGGRLLRHLEVAFQ